MNKIYRIVWSASSSAWVVASEFARGDTRGAAPSRAPLRRRALACGVALFLAGAPPAFAQSWWDGTDTNANANGGNGTWSTGATNWDNALNGGANVAWANGMDAVFTGTGTVTLGAGGVNANSLRFDGTAYTFNATTGNKLTLSGTAEINAAVSGLQHQFNVELTGGSGLIKTGLGGIQLNNANTYTGVTKLQEGVLTLNNASALGNATNDAANFLVSGGTTINFNNASYNRLMTLSGGTVTFGGNTASWSGTPTLTANTTLSLNGTLTLSGALADTAGFKLSLTNNSAGTLTGTNTYTGQTRLTGGTLALGSMAALPSNSNLAFDAASDAFITLPGNFARTLGNGDTQVQWIRSGGFMSNTTGTKTINLGTDLIWGTTPSFLATGATLDLAATSGFLDFRNNLALPTGGTTYTTHVVGTLAAHPILSGVVSGGGNLLVTGNITGFNTSLLELSGANTFSGQLILAGTANEGNVLVSGATSLPSSANLRFNGGATTTGANLVLGNGNFTDALGTGADQVQWTGNGGFSATGAARFVDIGNGATLTWNTLGFVPTNSWLTLATAGDTEIDFRNDINLNGAARTIAFGTGGTPRLTGDLSNGSVVYRGAGASGNGAGSVEGNSIYTGTTTIGSGSGTTTINVTAIGNGGTSGNLGAATNAASNLILNGGSIAYRGAGETSNRNLTVQTAGGSLVNNGTGALGWNGITGQSGATAFTLGGTAANTLINHVDGLVQNGGATLGIDKTGISTWQLANTANTYTGATRIATGVLEVTSLANGGIASSIGASTNAAANLVGTGGTLRYVGATNVSTDRNFQMANVFAIESSGAGVVNWAPTTGIAIVATSPVLTLGGTNTGANTMNAPLTNHTTANNVNQISTGLTKSGIGTWHVGGGTDSTYTGNTTLIDGLLIADTAKSITGGFDFDSNTTASTGYTSIAAPSSLILFNTGGSDGGVLALSTANNGLNGFRRALSTAGQAFTPNGAGTADDTFVQGVRWASGASGGFAAMDGTQVVNIGGASAPVTWGSNGFVGGRFILGATTAAGTVDFQNSIGLANAARTFDVRDGSASVDAILSGLITAGGAGSSFNKIGAGTLALTANNASSGGIFVQAGTLQIGNGGTTGAIGNNANVSAGATLAFDRSNAVSYTNLLSGAGTLRQQGTGTTTLTNADTIGATQVTNGTLVATNTLTTSSLSLGAGTMRVSGTMQASGASRVAVSGVAGTAGTLQVDSGGTLRANGTLGDGNDTLRVAGTLDTTGGLTLGAGDDAYDIVDGSNAGDVDGGADNDTATATLALDAQVGALLNFETLNKSGIATLNLIGPTASSIANINLNAGRVRVQNGASVNGPASGAQTTTIANGSRLSVDLGGSYGCGTGDDTLSVAGIVDGAGTVSQCGGNDTLTLHDGATLSLSGAIDGGAQTTFDRVLVDVASALTFDGARVSNYEQLTKQGAGTLTLAGNHAYSGGVTQLAGSEVIVGGALDSSSYTMTGAGTLTVTGSATNAGSAMMFTGDAAVQSFDLRAGGTLMALGTLGDGADTVTLAGTLDTGVGVLALGAGNDRIDLLDGGTLRGEIDGDTGTDSLVANIGTNASIETLLGFESLHKSGVGTLTFGGGSTNNVDAVTVDGGRLDITSGTLVFSQGTNAMTVDIGPNATLDVAGLFGCSAQADTWTIAGTVSGGGAKQQCDGDDTLLLRDGASITGTAIDGGTALTGDTVVIDNAASMTTGNFTNYETLRKQNTGNATLSGDHTFANGIDLQGGTLTLANTTLTDQVDMAGATTLQIDGTLRGNTGLATTIDGDAGAQTVVFAGTGTVHADLGDGADVFEVMSDVRTDGGAVMLGAGDDMFVLHEGANLFGTVDAGAGLDTFNQNVTTTATIGTALGFEALAKAGVGTLVFDGTVASDFQQVTVSEGLLRVASGASFVTPATVVEAAGTLRVDGSYGCGTGNDTLDIAGTFEVNGTVDQCGGDDIFTLRDGATLLGAGVVNGGAQTVADTFVLDIAGTRTLDANEVAGYEVLSKRNTGDVTLAGLQAYDARVEVQGGTLAIDGTLTTTQLALTAGTAFAVQAGGRAEGLAGNALTIGGSTGVDTVIVGAGGTLLANGDLGGGNDILDLAGTLDTDGGTLLLGAGDDEVRIYDTSNFANATVDAGAGNDLLDINLGTGVTFQLGSTGGFESLGKSGGGTMQVDGANTFTTVRASDGLMHVASTGTLQATTLDLESAGTLRVDGALRGTGGNDTFTLAGALTGAGSVDLGAGNDTLVFNDGADSVGFTQTLQGGLGVDTLEVDIAGNATLAATDGFETLQKDGIGALSIAGDNVFDVVALDAGILRVQTGADVTGSGAAFSATLAAGTTLELAGTFGCNTGNDSIVVDSAVTGAGAMQQCAGDDVLRVRDGADFSGFTGAIDGGADNDIVQLDTASAMTFGGDVVNYETLQKVGAGIATLTGNANFATQTAVDAGVLQIAGVLETAQLALADDTTLRIDGSASGVAATQAALVGSAGTNTLIVGTNALLRASGSLGDGDDTLTLQDGARIIGAIDGGAGLDTFNTDIATTARFGAATGFEALDKTGAGVLEIAGTAVSDFARVTVSAGTLDLQAGGAIRGAQTTTVAANATFNVAGTFDATSGMDLLDIAGAVTGNTLSMGDGDDVLRLRDGSSLSALVDGGLPTASDAIVLDATNALAFDATRAINFESLQKLGAGMATVSGDATYNNVALDAGALTVTGQLVANAFALADDTTLRIDGAAVGVMNGTSGTNTIIVGTGATLTGAGDLGAGDDVLDVIGRLDTEGNIFRLGDGDDRLVVHDTTQIVGTGGLDAGAGNDTLNVVVGAGNVVPVPALAGFESLGKAGLGTLELNGASDFIDVAVMDGQLHVASGGTMQAQNLQVAGPALLQLDGGFAGTTGDDTVSIAGRVAGAGAFALADGNDILTLQDGADLSGFASTLDGGAGVDTLSADIATQASLAPSVNFETLSKTGVGVLSVAGAQSFDRTYVGEGTLDVLAGATLTSRSTLVVAGATLDVAGAFAGTDGDDDFESAGTVRGALAFGAGNDRVLVTGGPFEAQADGGAGIDTLTFRQQALVDNHVAALRNFERLSLEASTLELSTSVIGVDVVELDAASTLTTHAGASLAGTLANGGMVRVDDARLSIGRDYIAGPSSLLHLLVSPGRNTAGGLTIAGNVTGSTSVIFDSDGSTGGSTASILVIDSPNDVPDDGGAFTSDGVVRLAGSPYAWSFAQADDNRWYLGTDAEVVPEMKGYAALPAMALDTLRGTRLATFGHLDAIRGSSDCNRENARDGHVERRDCSGAWMSAGGIETRIGEGGGLAYSGDSHGLHIGIDGTVHQDAAREVRVGGFAGQVEGNYWTRSDVNVRLDGPVFGAYGELRSAGGGYFNVALMHQRNDATVIALDGFKQEIEGDALALVHQAGWQLDIGNGWSLEPQAQVGITRARWKDVVDASGKPLTFVDDTTGEVRAALRVERAFLDNGAMWRPWFTVALEDTIGESKASLSVQDLAMPGEALGQRWTFDAGLEAKLHNGLSVFGAVGVRRELNGPTQDSQQARIGLRWAW